MNNNTMQIAFRQYAQQMGMQNIRTLLPEQIDMLINASIVDILNQLIKEHIAGTTEKGGSDNTKLSQINAFRNLYVVKEFSLDGLYPNNPPSGGGDGPNPGGDDNPGGGDTPGDDDPTDDTYYEIVATLRGDTTGAEMSIDPAITGTLYGSSATKAAKAVETKPVVTPTINTPVSSAYNVWPNLVRYSNRLDLKEVFHIVDSAISYNIPKLKQETSWFPIRLIDEQYLAESLRDSFLRPTFKSPIGVYYNTDKIVNTFDFYVSRTKNNLIVPTKFKLSYIKVPKKVDYTKPNDETDMPIHLHDIIVRHGVDLYRASIGQQTSQAQPSQNVQ